MKWLVIIMTISFYACSNKEVKQSATKKQPETVKTTSVLESKDTIVSSSSNFVLDTIFDELTLLSFLDSINQLNLTEWMDSTQHMPDSFLFAAISMYFPLSSAHFSKLKKADKTGQLSKETAEAIFPFLELKDYDNSENVFLRYYHFDNNRNTYFKQFAIMINYQLYFFNGSTIIGKHQPSFRFEFEINHFKNAFGQTVVYYKNQFASGTGIWWYQNYFYKYERNKLIPVLTEMNNINLQYPWSFRSYWIDSKIVSTEPLSIKFLYNNQFHYTERDFTNDSTIISYTFDDQNQLYIPHYEENKLSKKKLLSFSHHAHEFIFIQSHYDLLKSTLNSNDTEQRQAIFRYLEDLRE